jgi:hypothetical protein
MRRAARTDANQASIVRALRDAGASVYIIKLPTDLLVGYRGRTLIVEVKDGDKAPSKQALTKVQSEFMSTWRGGPVATVNSVESALRAINCL